MQYNLEIGSSLAGMMERAPNIARSVMTLTHKLIEMIHAENLKPHTVELLAMSPRGEPNKIFIRLLAGEYTDGAPIVLPKEDPSSPSYQLARAVRSLYQAVMKEGNSELQGFITCCPGLAEVIYSVSHYIYVQWYQVRMKDIPNPIVWDVYDHWREGDLVISGLICA